MMANYMKKILGFIQCILTLLVLLALAFGVGYYKGGNKIEKNEAVVEKNNDKFDFRLPWEKERRTITVEEVESKLEKIGELSTYSGEYTCTLGKEEIRYWMDKIPVLGTKNYIEITCNGIVKVGYNMNDIVAKVDDDTIYISIPEAQINDNYVIWDSVICKESNNVLNPIEFSQYQELVQEIEAMGLADVTSKDIYRSAEDNLKNVINNFLSGFDDDYTIVYM